MLLLSVQADWCHWCHVMNTTTYADPEVLALLADHFVVMRAEADARPDLAERYTNCGWPATILFAPDGRELVRLRGHRDPAAMRAILEAVIADPLAVTLTPIEENAIVARALMSLARIEDREDRQRDALAILNGVAVAPAMAELGRKIGEYAIALELAHLGTVSFTVVGATHDSRTMMLADETRAYFEPRRVIVMQPGEGHYPRMDEPASSCVEKTAARRRSWIRPWSAPASTRSSTDS